MFIKKYVSNDEFIAESKAYFTVPLFAGDVYTVCQIKLRRSMETQWVVGGVGILSLEILVHDH